MNIAVVTGASSGMGREFVLQLDRHCRKLDEIWVLARREDRLLKLKEQTKKTVRIFLADLEAETGTDLLLEQLKIKKPKIMFLVNAAGYGVHGAFAERPAKDTLGMVKLNCCALTAITNCCLPYLKKESRIINIASAAAFVPQPKFAVYAASKSYVLSFSRALRAELEQKHIYVTAVCPGPVNTEFFKKDNCNINETFYKKMMMAQPEKVVKKALIDSLLKKEVSVYGIAMKAFFVLTKVMPHQWMLNIMKHIL